MRATLGLLFACFYIASSASADTFQIGSAATQSLVLDQTSRICLTVSIDERSSDYAFVGSADYADVQLALWVSETVTRQLVGQGKAPAVHQDGNPTVLFLHEMSGLRRSCLESGRNIILELSVGVTGSDSYWVRLEARQQQRVAVLERTRKSRREWPFDPRNENLRVALQLALGTDAQALAAEFSDGLMAGRR